MQDIPLWNENSIDNFRYIDYPINEYALVLLCNRLSRQNHSRTVRDQVNNMNDRLKKVGNFLCYCGLSRGEYQSVRKDAYRSNYDVWKYLHLLIVLAYSVMAAFYTANGMPASAAVQTIVIIYAGFMSFLFYRVLKPESLAGQLLIYLTMILLMLSTLIIHLHRPQEESVAFVVMLVLFPMFMIDRPYYMAILLSVSVGVYLTVESGRVEPSVYVNDQMNAILYGCVGIIINIFYSSLRFREILLQKQKLQHLDELKLSNAETEKLNETLKKMSASTIDLLGDVVEGRDVESGEHIQRVKGYTSILANCVMKDLPEYQLDPYTVDLITFTSALHDVGKISIPDRILKKPGKLTAEEFEIMKTHCEKGRDIINKMKNRWSQDYLDMGVSICLNHHEKWDGNGYPRGLKGDEIPIAAQIVSIADIFDALTSKRVYKEAYSFEKAYEMILNGECGAFSERLLKCFTKCRDRFEAYVKEPVEISMADREYEIISQNNPEDSFVIGLHDQSRTLQEKIRLHEEVSVLESLSEQFLYVGYVDMISNEVSRYKADTEIARILDSFGDRMRSSERFDQLLNTIIVKDDYDTFRQATERKNAIAELRNKDSLTTDFRVRIGPAVHHCRMRISLDPNNKDAVIIGISKRDEEYQKDLQYMQVQQQLETAKREIEDREKLADRLAVINCISSEYDYVCSLNADTMEVMVYHAVDWIRDMFKNLESIVVSPETRDKTLRGVIHPDDFDNFQRMSAHPNVMAGLQKDGHYEVTYRAYKYGEPVLYQTRYTLDPQNPKRIVIGLRCIRKGW